MVPFLIILIFIVLTAAAGNPETRKHSPCPEKQRMNHTSCTMVLFVFHLSAQDKFSSTLA